MVLPRMKACQQFSYFWYVIIIIIYPGLMTEWPEISSTGGASCDEEEEFAQPKKHCSCSGRMTAHVCTQRIPAAPGGLLGKDRLCLGLINSRTPELWDGQCQRAASPSVRVLKSQMSFSSPGLAQGARPGWGSQWVAAPCPCQCLTPSQLPAAPAPFLPPHTAPESLAEFLFPAL